MKTFMFLSCIALLGLASCKEKGKSSPKAFFVPTQDHPFVVLGQGYNPSNGTFTARPCYESMATSMQKSDIEDAEIKIVRNAGLDVILNRLSGGLSLSYPIYPGVEAGGNVRLALSNASTSVSEAFSSFSRVTYSQSLQPQLVLSEYGKSVMAQADQQGLKGESRKAYLDLRCGEEIVDKIYYGATFNMLVDFDYGSSLAKQRFGAGLQLDLLGGVATIKADANILNDSFAESISLAISVKQVGGTPEYITKLFPDGLPRCDYTLENAAGWSQECKEAVEVIYSYAYGLAHPRLADIPTFISQLQDLDKSLVPLAYETHPRQENDPLKLLAFTDSSRSAIYQARELAIRAAMPRLEYIGAAEKSFNSMLRSNASFQNVNAYALYYQKILRQLELVSALKQELMKHIDDCWQMKEPCTPTASNEKIAAIEAKYPYDQDLSRYNKLVLSLSDWCKELGPQNGQDTANFPKSRLFDPEKNTLITLFRFTGIKPAPSMPENSEEQAKVLAERCGALEANLASRAKIDLSRLGAAGLNVESSRVLDFMPGLEELDLSDQIVTEIPRFYGLPRLKSLIIKNTRAHRSKLAAARELPPSLRCMDLSAPDVVADITKYIRPELEFLVLRGWNLFSLSVPAGLKSLIISSLAMETRDLTSLGAAIDHDLEIRITNDPGPGDIPPGSYGRIKVTKDDGTFACQKI